MQQTFKRMELKSQIFVLLFCLLKNVNCSLYPVGSRVTELTPENFDQLVMSSDEMWVVEFYAPWCGHCQSLVPEYEKAATALRGIVKVGSVDCDKHAGLGNRFNIPAFPTIKIFGKPKNSPIEYTGDTDAKGIAEACLNAANDQVHAILGGTHSSEKRKHSGSSSHVIELTDSNFDNNVLKSGDMWLVEFFAPWCGHCQNLESKWKGAAAKLEGKVRLGALDSTVHTVKARQYKIQGYPTIKFFNKGNIEEYDGGRTESDIVEWALKKLALNIPPPEVLQLLDNNSFDKTCKDSHICVLAVLPNILDCQSKCRNEYINMLTRLGDRFKDKMWGWFWMEAVSQPQLEMALDIGGFGYPALAVLNSKRMQYALFKGSFDYDGLQEFLRDISYGMGRVSPVGGEQIPQIRNTDAWDGKDGVLEIEEEDDDFDVDEKSKEEL